MMLLQTTSIPDNGVVYLVQNDGDVKIVVENYFDEIVLDESKDVLLEICDPWCGHCQALKPIYNKLGKYLRGINSLVIAKMDGTKLLDVQVESRALENLVEHSETPSDSGNLTIGESTSHRQRELEPTTRPANLEPSSYDVVNSNSKEDTTSSPMFSITEDSLASQQHEKGIDSLTVADSTANTQRVETPAKQYYGDFLHDQVDIKDIAEFNYVKDILELSGFSGKVFLGTWHSIGQPIDPSMLEEVKSCLLNEPGSCENEEVQYCNRILMFDLVNEVLLDIRARSFTYFPMPLTCRSHISPMPVGYHVLEEVWADISWYLNWRPEFYQSLDDVVSRDLDKDDGWMNLQFDAECVGVELEDMIFEDLFDEMIFDDLLEELYWT